MAAAARQLIRLAVNGRSVSVPLGTTVLEAARLAGIHIPTLCYHPRTKQDHGALCRACLVERSGEARPVPACLTAARQDDRIVTDSAALQAFRRSDVELLLSQHPNDCMRCEVNGQCKFQDLVRELGLESSWVTPGKRGDGGRYSHPLHDHTSPAIARDLDKCIGCGLCEAACGEHGQNMNVIGSVERGHAAIFATFMDTPLHETNCISCGQASHAAMKPSVFMPLRACTAVCPVGALVERPDWHRVMEVLDNRRRTTVVQVAPASRIAIGEEFGFEPGTVSTGRLVNALRALGFDYVFDTNFAADVTIMEEATELLQRVSKVPGCGPLPLFTSCCPGWVNYVEISRPDLLPHLSTTKSPQQMHGALTKRGPFAALSAGKPSTSGSSKSAEEPFVVAVMPCTAKKDEAVRPGMSGDVDAVLTTRELARLLRARHVPFAALSNSGSFDNPLGESTGAAQIFGASGGVMEAALRTAVCVLNPQATGLDRPLEFEAVRGVRDRVKVAHVDGLGKVAVVNGIAAAVDLLSNEAWRHEFVMIEVMACVGGCLGGGGEPKSDDPEVLQKRMRGVYAIDAGQARRRSHENPDVQRLYALTLKEPMSHEAERLLHRTYAARDSLRELVARFLEAVDHRRAEEASSLFEEEGEWQPFPGAAWLKGRAAIAAAVAALPSAGASAELQRHRFLDPVNGLSVRVGDQRLQLSATLGLKHKRQLRRLAAQPL